ncbi:hypothetical protein APB67_08910, partial [Pseudomonas aeruginosa]
RPYLLGNRSDSYHVILDPFAGRFFNLAVKAKRYSNIGKPIGIDGENNCRANENISAFCSDEFTAIPCSSLFLE